MASDERYEGEMEEPEFRREPAEELIFPPDFFAKEGFNPSIEPVSRSEGPAEVRVLGVYQAEMELNISHFVRVTDGASILTIAIGGPEAKSILDAMENVIPDRPMTHDFIKSLMDKLGATLDHILIDDLWQDRFYAKVMVEAPSGAILEVDARPSDAIALALRLDAPILVNPRVFEAAGV
jgi:bifunctional DNase/RNase